MTAYSKHRLHVLDGMRGIAAILVMLYHYYSDLYLRCLKNPFIAVDFFFILSGFVIFHAYGEKLRNGLPASEYLARRVGRLYPMLALGLLVGLPVLYINTVSTPSDYTRHDIVSTLASNFAMLPYITGKKQIVDHATRAVHLFPSNNALWSISFEMLASIIFLALFRLREHQLRTFCISWFGLLIMASFFHGFTGHERLFDMNSGWDAEDILGGFPRLFYSFSAGMLIYVWRFTKTPRQLEKIKFSINPLLLYGALIGMLVFPSFVQGLYDLFAVAVLAPLLVWFGSIATCRDRLTTTISEFLGWVSFPLYCLHMPVRDALKAIDGSVAFSSRFGISPQLAAIAASIILSIIVGVIVDRLGLQRRLTNLLGRSFALLAR
jgi:peptidoglycan/LPS O-acetylase OafA/YrhL